MIIFKYLFLGDQIIDPGDDRPGNGAVNESPDRSNDPPKKVGA